MLIASRARFLLLALLCLPSRVYTRSEYIPLRAVKVYTFFPETRTKHSRLASADQINCLSGCGELSFDMREVTCFNVGDDAAADEDDDDFAAAAPAKRSVVGPSVVARMLMRPANTGAAVLAGTRGGLWPSIAWHCETLLPQGVTFASANVSCERAPSPNSRTHVLRGSCRIYYALSVAEAPSAFSLQSFFEAAKSGNAPAELQNILGAMMNGGQLHVEQGSGKVSVVEQQRADTPAPTVEVVSSTADAAREAPPAKNAAEDEPPAGESSREEASESPRLNDAESPPDVGASEGQREPTASPTASPSGSALRALLDLKNKMKRRRTWGEAEA